MAAESETMRTPENRNDTGVAKETKKMTEDKTEKDGEETKMDLAASDKDAERKDENSSPPALDKEKETESSEAKSAGGQEKTAASSTPTSTQPQTNPQPYVQYVPPYRAIVQGLSGDVLGPKNVPRDSKTNYRDFSKMTDPIPDGRNRGGVAEVFPIKLQRMLRQTEFEGKGDIVSFCSHGRAFMIHKPKRFEAEIMTNFFRQTRVQSFQRQLNLYGFKRITRGPDTGGYYHELFLRGRPGLCVNMQRTRIKGVPKQPDDPESEPDFYSLPPMPDSGSSTPQQLPMSNVAPTSMFPSYMYPMPAGVAGPYTIAQTQPPGLPPYTAAQLAKNNGSQSMPPPYGVFPFPYSAYNQGQATSQQQARQGGVTKPPETRAESVGIIVENPDVSQKVNV